MPRPGRGLLRREVRLPRPAAGPRDRRHPHDDRHRAPEPSDPQPAGLVPGDADAVSDDPAVATLMSPNGVGLDPAGNLYIPTPATAASARCTSTRPGGPRPSSPWRARGSAALPVTAGRRPRPIGANLYIRTDAGGALYVSDGDRVRRIGPGVTPGDGSIDGASDEVITTYAGGGTGVPGASPAPATSLALGHTLGLALSSGGDLYVGLFNGILRVDRPGRRPSCAPGSPTGPPATRSRSLRTATWPGVERCPISRLALLRPGEP